MSLKNTQLSSPDSQSGKQEYIYYTYIYINYQEPLRQKVQHNIFNHKNFLTKNYKIRFGAQPLLQFKFPDRRLQLYILYLCIN